MKVQKPHLLILVLILLIAFGLRFYRLGNVPAGFHQDEVSQAYNSFSIATTGNDRYGEKLPILFRSFGSYQPPIYTYMSYVPMKVFGNTIFSARLLSALAGVAVVFFTYLVVVEAIKYKQKHYIALMSAFVVAISPWAIHFSRRVVEGNLGLAFFLAALYLLYLSLRRIKMFPLAALVFGLSTHAYYSERLITMMFIPVFLIYFREYYLKHKTLVISGLIIFVLTQIPHIWIMSTGAFARRFDQVSYINNAPEGIAGIVFIGNEFITHYLSYLSPANLFSDTGNSLARVAQGVGAFYSWMFIPFLFGIYFVSNNFNDKYIRSLAMLFLISLIPAAMTGDVFYPLRILEFLWLVSLVIAVGLITIGNLIKRKKVAHALLGLLTVFSLGIFYTSYFVLFQNETTEYVGVTYIKLNEYLEEYGDKEIIIDSARDLAIGLRIAYFREYDPKEMASNLRPQLRSNYYSGDVGIDETYLIDNITVRHINWQDPCKENTMIVGDALAINDVQAEEHGLELEFEIKNSFNETIVRGYLTNPKENCK